jgi:uncharacterized protein (TIRG00374 family)
LKTSLKILVSLALLGWLMHSGKLQFSSLRLLLDRPYILVALIAVWMLGIFLCSLRWNILLEGIGIIRSYKKTLYLNLMSSAFTSFLPGTMGSDVVKAVYISKGQEKKGPAVFSIFLDRAMGFVALTFLATLTSIISFPFFRGIPSLQAAALSCGLMFLASFSFVLFLLFGHKIVLPRFLEERRKKSPFFSILSLYQGNTRCIAHAFFWALLIHSAFISGYFLVTVAMNPGPVPFFTTAILVALGVTFASLPISPAGVGVGHFAFEELFSLMGLHGGANVFNIVFCTHAALNLLGFIPFLLGRGSLGKQ